MSRPPDWNRRIPLILLGMLALLLCIYLAKGSATTEEDRIRALLEQMAEEVEDKRPGKVISHLTSDFRVDPEGWTRDGTRTIMAGYFFGIKGRISVALRDVEIDIQGDQALATLRAGFVQGGELAAGLRPDQAYAFRCDLVKLDGEWMIRRVEKERTDW